MAVSTCVCGWIKGKERRDGMVGGKSPEVLNKETIRAQQVHMILWWEAGSVK